MKGLMFALLAASGFLLGLLFDLGDGGSMFL
jgi:hypothetical protein